MIDYLKLEANLKKFFDYEAEKKYDEKTDKIWKKGDIVYFGLLILLFGIAAFFIIKDYELLSFFPFVVLFGVLSAGVYLIIMVTITDPDKNFETDNYETEENLKKVSEFGIKNVTNFKENISLLRRKTEYMILDETFKETKIYSGREVYINKILNIFYGTDKTDLKKQDMELLELLKK